MPDMARHSSRSRLLFWLLGLVAISLLAIVLTTRTVLLGAVPEKANEDVIQELEEFRSLAQDGVDPETSQPFASNTRLLQVFLSRQIPTRDEALVGIVDGRLVGLPGPAGRSLAEGDPLIQHATESPMPAGVYVPDDGDPIHWGTVTVDGGEGSQEVKLMVARFTDSDYREIAELMRVVALVAAGVLVLAAFLAWLITGRLLAPIRKVSHQAAEDGRSGSATRLGFDGTDEITELARAYNDAWVREYEVRGINQLVTQAAAREIREGINQPEKLRATCESLMALSRLAPGTRGIATEQADLGVIARDFDAQAIDASGTAQVDRTALADALRAIAGMLAPHAQQPLRAGAHVNGDTARLWITAADFVADDEQAAAMISWPVSSTYAAVVRTVADSHGGRALVTADASSGTTVLLELPAGGEHHDESSKKSNSRDADRNKQ